MLATPNRWEGPNEAAGSDRDVLLRRTGAIVWLALVWLWWLELSREMLVTTLGDQATPHAALFAAIGGVVGRIGSELLEAGFYFAAWRALGRPLRFGPLFVMIASLSLFDLVALTLVQWAGESPPAWVVPLVGFHVLPGVLAGEPGLRLAFGSCGLLCLARLAGTAYAQKPSGAAWRGRIALTITAWLAGRLATWWTTDLLRGMSPMP